MEITATKEELEFIIDNYEKNCPRIGSCLIYQHYYGEERNGYVFKCNNKYYCILHNVDCSPYIEYVCDNEQEAIDKIRSYT